MSIILPYEPLITIRDDRPTFYYNNDINNELRAGGLIYYKLNKLTNEYDFLLIKSNNKYEDFGGRTDMCDKCIEDTVAREAEEESNNIFKKDDIYKIIIDQSFPNNKKLYTKYSKYIVYLVETDECYDPIKFGTIEYHDNIHRTVEWISYSTITNKEFIKNKLHFRLKYKALLDAIASIK